MSEKKIFNKPAKTIKEQCESLIDRGMNLQNKKSTEEYLSHINYYRLEAYWIPFRAIVKSGV